MQRRPLLLGTLALVAVVAAGLVLAVALPVDDPPAPSDPESDLYRTLAAAGFDDAVVTVSDERVLVRYNHPEGENLTEARRFVVRRAAAAAPGTSAVVVQVYRDYEPYQEVTVPTATVQAYNRGAVPASELAAETTVRTADG